jgi:hypothetical protein
MKFYLDTEFLHTSRTIDLISIGIMAEDGREYYAVCQDAPWERIIAHDWLMENVVESMLKSGSVLFERNPAVPADLGRLTANPDHRDVKQHFMIRREVMTFLLRHNDGFPPELWGWYSGFDYVVLSQLFGTMADYPSSLPMWINDLRQETERLGVYQSLPVQAGGLHNALEDAKWNKQVGEYLTGVAAARV